MKPHLVITRKVITQDSTGQKWGRIHIAFEPDVTATGSLTFAVWDYKLDNEADLQRAQNAAIENARTVIMSFAAQIAQQPIPA